VLVAAEVVGQHDGVLRPPEEELLRTLAVCLDVGVRFGAGASGAPDVSAS
jgi:hypothetical protein